MGSAGKVVVSSVIGCTVSEIGGGKFVNGAITAAYVTIFNQMMHRKSKEFKFKKYGQIPIDKKAAQTSLYIMRGNITLENYGDKIAILISATSASPGVQGDVYGYLSATIIIDGTDIGTLTLTPQHQSYITEQGFNVVGEGRFSGNKASYEGFYGNKIYIEPKSIEVRLKGGWWVYQGAGRSVPLHPVTKFPIKINETIKIK